MGLFKNTGAAKLKKFKRVTKGKSQEQIREAEMALLKPDPIPPYNGEHPLNRNDLISRSVNIVFKSQEDMNAFHQNIMPISYSIAHKKAYITDITLLMNLLEDIKKGKLIVDNKRVVPTSEVKDLSKVKPVLSDMWATVATRKKKFKKGEYIPTSSTKQESPIKTRNPLKSRKLKPKKVKLTSAA